MNRHRGWLWVSLWIACLQAGLLSSTLTYAGSISVTINGQAPPAPAQVNCDNSTQCVNVGGTYGTVAVAPVSAGSGRGAYARVEFPEALSDITHDSLRITNARITNTGADRTFTIVFEQEDAQQPNSTKYYNTYLNGNFGAVAGNSITSRSFYKLGAGAYEQIGSTLSHSVTCSSTCATAFSKKTGVQKNPGAGPRSIKIEMTVTLKAGSYVDLNSGGQIITSGTPPDDSANELVGVSSVPCPGCVPKSDLSVLCSTTYSTAKMFGCPSCVTEDGQVAAEAKVKLFVLANGTDLVQEMARGEGEHLASLATLLNIPENHQREFFEVAQEQHRMITGDEAPGQIIALIHGKWIRRSETTN